ncbi:2-hydroxychromene-2-carboxylate isomerase [Pelagibacteraceae bacterium]|nr:2-hydroxychromene-2-carboxylate isomerase [Pelagibacteraceae bacterium]|tara:strand:- start:44 stop:640 length:597 start_codon:yes stop_codon:yes gene_type:complete
MKIEYYFSVASPFAYLGSAKLQSIARKYNAEIIEKPCDLVGGIFSKTGGVPVPQRSPQRQKYRLDELNRWSKFLNIKININPKFFPPKDPHLPAKFTIAANILGAKLVFGHELLKQLWSEEKDISDEKNIEILSNSFKIDFKELSSLAKSEKISNTYTHNTVEAVEKNVFGAPTYIFNNELFWGQDRLEFLERALENA